VEKLKKNA